MNSQKKNKPSYSFKNIKRDSSERFLILGVSEYRRWIPRKTNMILGLSKWDTSIPWQSSFSFRSLWCGYIWTQNLVFSENRNNHTRLVMKYIFISILIIPFVSVTILFSLSTPVFGKTSQFESVDECVMKLSKRKEISLVLMESRIWWRWWKTKIKQVTECLMWFIVNVQRKSQMTDRL